MKASSKPVFVSIMVLVSEVMTEIREASPSHFLFEIKSFSLLTTHGFRQVDTSEFSAGGYRWKLIIDLNDKKTGIDRLNYISVKLAMLDTSNPPANWEVDATFSIFLFNHISCNYLYSHGVTRRFLALKSEWGISEFISKKVLKDPSKGYLMNDICVFGAEVFVVEKSAMHNRLFLKNVRTPHKHSFKISKFSGIKSNLWTSEKFTVEGHKWHVKVYPKGNGDGAGKSVSIYLCYDGSERVMANFKIRLRNKITNKNVEMYTVNPCWFVAGASSLGWQKFYDISCVRDPGKGFTIEDCLELETEISVLAVLN